MQIILVESNTVVNVVTANSVTEAQNTYPTYDCFEQPNQYIVVGYVTEDGGRTFIYPSQPDPPSPVWAISRFALLSRFTANEAIAMHMAAQGTGQNAATMQYFLNALNIAEYIDLQSNTTIQMVGELVQFGILTQDRANTILQTPAAPNEKVT